jgi:hypothetical protein
MGSRHFYSYIPGIGSIPSGAQQAVYPAELFSSSGILPLDDITSVTYDQPQLGRNAGSDEGNFVNCANPERNAGYEGMGSSGDCEVWPVPRGLPGRWSGRPHPGDLPLQVSGMSVGGARVKLRGSSLWPTMPGMPNSNSSGVSTRETPLFFS